MAFELLNAFCKSISMLPFVGYATPIESWNALWKADCMSARYLSSSIASKSLRNISPFSEAASRSRPISIGSIPSLASISASFASIASPSLTTILSSVMTIFPPSILHGIPTPFRSPSTGPAGNGVSPFLTRISSGARSPPFAGADILPSDICL